MIRASRLKLPPGERPVPFIPPWLLGAILLGTAAICWWLHITVGAVLFGIFASVIVAGLVEEPILRRRQLENAARLPRDATWTYGRSFDFRRTDTLVLRAVYEALQPFVGFPIQASHRLSEDHQIDNEDLNLDVAPIIAQRLRRTLSDPEENPYYGRVQTVEDLVHFMEAQPSEIGLSNAVTIINGIANRS